jgi:hypothetical protein
MWVKRAIVGNWTMQKEKLSWSFLHDSGAGGYSYWLIIFVSE